MILKEFWQIVKEQGSCRSFWQGFFYAILLIMKTLLSILFVITIMAAILALCVWLMFHSASKNHYPDIKDL